ncbi:hypothetical protein I4N56_005645 [Pseudomonas mohnii]|uniref:hypothetical protein n=1 Tax=Pseudomonas mohnii TaxID=395600 RepID=UPI0018C49F85|nr:hypothetical protein [Pseudomonas mohnii]MBH8610477.1 hypothetical protein [Pseudomonas mohnii]
MQKQLISLVAALLISSPLIALAADEPPANTSPTASATATPQDKAWSEQLQKMQAAHEKMAAAKTPAERRIAMQEGMDAMRGGIGMMQGQCPGMGMGKGMAGGKYHSDQMMDLMQKMMDQQSSMMKQPLGQ